MMTAEAKQVRSMNVVTTHDTDIPLREDEFLAADDIIPVRKNGAERVLRQCLADLEEFTSDKKWEDAIEIFHPVEEKLPELVKYGLDGKVRAKLAFVMGQIKRFDDAIKELTLCIKTAPEEFQLHSSLAYTAYNSLYAGANREIFLRGRIRAERIELAHKHFRKAQDLRQDGVTNFYREGMLLKQIENKPEKALPLFERAVSNWDGLTEEQKEYRRQERKNFVKSLYQLAGTLLKQGHPRQALEEIERCLSEDEHSHHISLLFKYFALGKVHFHRNDYEEARDALEFAFTLKALQPKDFVCELLARTYLALNAPLKAMKIINRVPEKMRRPYYRWTEADVLCALKDFHKARQVLNNACERDNRSKHKALIRLSKIHYLLGDYQKAMKCGFQAEEFYQQKWGNHCDDALFWQAAGAYRLGEKSKALELALKLKANNPRYDKLNTLLEKLG